MSTTEDYEDSQKVPPDSCVRWAWNILLLLVVFVTVVDSFAIRGVGPAAGSNAFELIASLLLSALAMWGASLLEAQPPKTIRFGAIQFYLIALETFLFVAIQILLLKHRSY